MIPGSAWLKQLTPGSLVPQNATIVACIIPLLVSVWAFVQPGALTPIAAFGTLAIYVCFQMVVFAALVQRLKGWRPAGDWTLGKWGLPINVAAMAFGLLSMVVLVWPGSPTLPFVDRWTVLIGLGVVLGFGLLYMAIAKPYNNSHGPEGDAIEVANLLHAQRLNNTTV
jgi:hypothetical protein